MNSREAKRIKALMREQFGTIIEGVFYQGSKRRIYLGTEYSKLVDIRSVNAEGIGLYIGRVNDDGFRPSIEGAQLLMPKKNVYEINEEQLWEWLRGYTIEIETDYEGYCALSHKGEVIGPGKIANKNVWNYVPKERRIKRLIK